MRDRERPLAGTPPGRAVRLEYLCIAVLPENARSCRRQGLPDRHGAGTSVRKCMPDGDSSSLTARRIASHGARRAAGTQARTIQLPQAPWTWIRAGDKAPALDHRRALHPGRRPCRGTPPQSRPPLRSSKRLPGTAGLAHASWFKPGHSMTSPQVPAAAGWTLPGVTCLQRPSGEPSGVVVR
jgi:hypothetical protein